MSISTPTPTPTFTPTLTTTSAAAAPRLVTGLNHVAIVTADLDRLREFYVDVFDGDVLEVPAPPGTRSVVVQLTPSCGLALMEVGGNPHTGGSGQMLDRGHLDHLALDAPTPAALGELRDRLVACGASDGTITDYGIMLSLHFVDPDGMASEVCWMRPGGPAAHAAHPPQPFTGSLDAFGLSGN